jgi:Tfp pilus assembly PilM family ATPase
MAPERHAAIGLQLSDHAIRVARLEFRDVPRLTDAAALRLPTGVITNGIVVDEPAVIEMLRRVWEQLKFTWEPTHVALGTNDARLVMLDLGDADACAELVNDLRADFTHTGDDFVALALRDAAIGEPVPVALAARASIDRTVSVLERSGISVAGVDTVPTALTRTQPAAWIDVDDVALRLEDGPTVWSVRVGSMVGTQRSWRVVADEETRFESVRLSPADMTIRPITALADVVFGDRLSARFTPAQLAVAIGAALASGPNRITPIDLRSAPIVRLPRQPEFVGEPGLTWVIEPLTPLPAMSARKRRG